MSFDGMKFSVTPDLSIDKSAASTNRWWPCLAVFVVNDGVAIVNVDDVVDKYKNTPPPFPFVTVGAAQLRRLKFVDVIIVPPFAARYIPPPHPSDPVAEQLDKLTFVIVSVPDAIVYSATHPFPFIRLILVNVVFSSLVKRDKPVV
jgi:hypothetical protein